MEMLIKLGRVSAEFLYCVEKVYIHVSGHILSVDIRVLDTRIQVSLYTHLQQTYIGIYTSVHRK